MKYNIITLLTSSLIFSSIIRDSQTKRLMTREEMIQSPFHPEMFNGIWYSDTGIVYNDQQVLKLMDVTTKQSVVLGDGTYLKTYQTSSFLLTSDNQWILLQHDCKSVYRYSNLCNYTIVEIKSGTPYKVAGGKKLQLFRWIPNSHSFVYVMDNDVYFQDNPSEWGSIRLTSDGVPGVIFNGIGDWVYEEEVLRKSRAMCFSPGGTKFAYLRYDDSNVAEVHYPEYGSPGSLKTQYVKDKTMRYPKVGTPNPKASVHLIDLKTRKAIEIDGIRAPLDLVTDDYILARVAWVDDDNVVAAWTNRAQTIAVSMICKISTAECHKILETRQDDGWVEYPIFFFKSVKFFVTLLPQPQGDAGTFQHLTVVSSAGQRALTTGKRVVYSIVDYDTTNSLIYYLATDETNPTRLQLYVIPDNSSTAEKCLSCNICGTAEAAMSLQKSYFILYCFGPDPPSFYVYSSKGELITTLKTNSNLEKRLEEIYQPSKVNDEISTGDGMTARVRLILPSSFDSNKKYPLLLSIGDEPDGTQFDDKYYAPDFDSYMATVKNVIVGHIDAKGSGRRGNKLKFAIYKRFGGPEIDDIIYLTKKLIEKYVYIDANHIGIWGSLYGGYATAMVLAKDRENIFKCGISVAPRTCWSFHDSIYTERYMGSLSDNKAGYNNSDVTKLVEGLRGKTFLLVHGTSDDNTHYQHTAALARSLQTNNIPYQMMSYIDESFSLHRYSSFNIQRHHMTNMENFWNNCFSLDST
uniref:Venom dipeptidyl peptidase 4 n=1 Tax=Nilaparvata lugens TaxID=108931 RepID=A0A191UR56_NILLU|nr:venom dipeptidyl peptidase [Nilaparvata lugens]